MSPAESSGNEITSVGRSCFRWVRLSVRIRAGPTKVIESASTFAFSAARTPRAIRATSCEDSGTRTVALTRTSGALNVPVRGDAAVLLGVVDALVVHRAQHPGEGPPHHVDLRQGERRFAQLPRLDPTL